MMERTTDIKISMYFTYHEAALAAQSAMWMLGHFVGSLNGDVPTIEATRHMENMHRIAQLLSHYAVGDGQPPSD